MFTGLVESMGTVCGVVADSTGTLLTIEESTIAPELPLGASVAVNGVCLTVVAINGQAPVVQAASPAHPGRAGEPPASGAIAKTFSFQAGPETLQRTNLGEMQPGMRVNLERSLRVGDRLGGHIVQGHVDGVGSIAERKRDGEWEYVWFRCDPQLTRQMIRKGSITIDGVSLTLVDVEHGRFSVALIPHTMAVTTLGFKQVGDSVNLETDLFAKYVFKYMEEMELPF
ncbi:MAG TPA: riboflavin synthase [Gemmataceae bacterium]|nr:riboflavin synthase [Gemmataceae bacterium]